MEGEDIMMSPADPAKVPCNKLKAMATYLAGRQDCVHQQICQVPLVQDHAFIGNVELQACCH